MREVKDESLYSANYFEYSVLKKKDGKTLALKFGIVLGAITILALYVIIFSKLLDNMTAYFIPLLSLLLVILGYVFWKYTAVEYEYEIVSGEFTMKVVYGGRKNVTLFSKRISQMDFIASYDSDNKKIADSNEYKHIYKCVSSMENSKIYFAVFNNEKNEKCIVFFEAPKKVITILKFYNSTATYALKYIQE